MEKTCFIIRLVEVCYLLSQNNIQFSSLLCSDNNATRRTLKNNWSLISLIVRVLNATESNEQVFCIVKFVCRASLYISLQCRNLN